MRTVAFCEIDPYCRAVLRKHWPDVPIYGDVTELTAKTLANTARHLRRASGDEIANASDGPSAIEVICGGFPCQDISVAGKGAGIEGKRSGLWSEYARIIGEVRPRYVIVENVAALLGRGLARVLGDLAALGYDAEWHCIPASAVGAPHRRDRVWIVAHARCAHGYRRQNNVARGIDIDAKCSSEKSEILAYAAQQYVNGAGDAGPRWRIELTNSGWWLAEPAIRQLADGFSLGLVRYAGRTAKGVPNRVQKLRALGNAIVPQIAEIIGRAIMNIERGDQ
jgi:DNA (cytosine-5)-methyltransferase 1